MILIKNATVVNEGTSRQCNVLVDNEEIAAVLPAGHEPVADVIIDARDCLLLPGVIDEHVHLREPGLEQKADIESETRAAAAGGVTTLFDMPNTVPQTTTLEAWAGKMELFAARSRVNYACFVGATNNNIDEIEKVDKTRVPGIKLFMGASTGNMLVDKCEALAQIFKRSPMLVMVHAEDQTIINRNTKELREREGEDPAVENHSDVRSREACISSTRLAIELALHCGARLHVAHVSTREELEMIVKAGETITGEACLPHLLFTTDDYAGLGSRIKCNPAVKTAADRAALRKALSDNKAIYCIATDHAPHRLADKQGGCFKAASGMPMVQFSLCAMLTLSSRGVLPVERVVELMCHNPARLFDVRQRGFIKPGFKADLVLVKKAEWTIDDSDVVSKCGWTPLKGAQLDWKVVSTFVNGRQVYNRGTIDTSVRGQAVTFDR